MTRTVNTEIIRCRINPDIKREGEAILDSIGMSTSEAMRLFFRQLVNRGEFPLELKTPQPNQITIDAFNETDLDTVSMQDLQDM